MEGLKRWVTPAVLRAAARAEGGENEGQEGVEGEEHERVHHPHPQEFPIVEAELPERENVSAHGREDAEEEGGDARGPEGERE